jgi:hypothetical protein
MQASGASSGLLDQLVARLGAMKPEELAAATQMAAKATAGMRWIPNPGPQTDAYFCKADVLLYGGQGGGGKSELGLGLAFTAHRRSLILRRQYTDLGALIDRALEINGTRSGFNGSPPPKLTTPDDRLIRFGANQRLGDEQSWQGQPFDLKVFDEACQFLEMQIRFHLGWLRSTVEGQRTRAILPSNPPVTADGQWIVGMFRPWLDITHPKQAKAGELRWYVTDPDGKDFEVDGPELYQFPGVAKAVLPHSRTFIPAELRDNPYLIRTNYQAQLDALPEPLRSAIRDGNFMAARKDDEWQVIPSAWIVEAQKRWTANPPAGVPMCAMAVDASGGGDDPMTIARRHDAWYAPMIEVAGKDIPKDRIGTYCAGIVVSHRRDEAKVIVDLGGGYGGGIFEHLKTNSIDVDGYKGAASATGRTRDRQMSFVNKRSEVIWRFREALDPDQPGGSPIALPNDPLMVADLTAPTWEPVSHKGGMAVKVESKEDVCARLGRSTDRGDAVVMAWSGGLKQQHVRGGFQAAASRRPQTIMGHQAVRRSIGR